MQYPDISKWTGRVLSFQVAIVIGLDMAAILVPAVAQQGDAPSPGVTLRNVDITPEQYRTLSPAISHGKSKQELERILGIPQGYIPSNQWGQPVVYFGPVPDAETWVPIVLGPIEITYSQYNTVMGKRYYGNRPRNKDRSSGEPNGETVEKVSEGKWSSILARIQENMPRDDVEEILGKAQAYDQLLVASYATGPSIPHQEAFYGPLVVADAHQPLHLGTITVFFSSLANHANWVRYRWQCQGSLRQAWPQRVVDATDIPIVEGWAARFKRVKIGMTEAEVQRILGPPTDDPFSGPHEVSYGPHFRAEDWHSSLGRPKITIDYSTDGAVTGKKYRCDKTGFESDMGCPAQELHPGP